MVEFFSLSQAALKAMYVAELSSEEHWKITGGVGDKNQQVFKYFIYLLGGCITLGFGICLSKLCCTEQAEELLQKQKRVLLTYIENPMFYKKLVKRIRFTDQEVQTDPEEVPIQIKVGFTFQREEGGFLIKESEIMFEGKKTSSYQNKTEPYQQKNSSVQLDQNPAKSHDTFTGSEAMLKQKILAAMHIPPSEKKCLENFDKSQPINFIAFEGLNQKPTPQLEVVMPRSFAPIFVHNIEEVVTCDQIQNPVEGMQKINLVNNYKNLSNKFPVTSFSTTSFGNELKKRPFRCDESNISMNLLPSSASRNFRDNLTQNSVPSNIYPVHGNSGSSIMKFPDGQLFCSGHRNGSLSSNNSIIPSEQGKRSLKRLTSIDNYGSPTLQEANLSMGTVRNSWTPPGQSLRDFSANETPIHHQEDKKFFRREKRLDTIETQKHNRQEEEKEGSNNEKSLNVSLSVSSPLELNKRPEATLAVDRIFSNEKSVKTPIFGDYNPFVKNGNDESDSQDSGVPRVPGSLNNIDSISFTN